MFNRNGLEGVVFWAQSTFTIPLTGGSCSFFWALFWLQRGLGICGRALAFLLQCSSHLAEGQNLVNWEATPTRTTEA